METPSRSLAALGPLPVSSCMPAMRTQRPQNPALAPRRLEDEEPVPGDKVYSTKRACVTMCPSNSKQRRMLRRRALSQSNSVEHGMNRPFFVSKERSCFSWSAFHKFFSLACPTLSDAGAYGCFCPMPAVGTIRTQMDDSDCLFNCCCLNPFVARSLVRNNYSIEVRHTRTTSRLATKK